MIKASEPDDFFKVSLIQGGINLSSGEYDQLYMMLRSGG